LSARELSDALGWGATKTSKIENGRQLPTEADLRAWTGVCKAEDQADSLIDALNDATALRLRWQSRHRRGLEGAQRSWVDRYATAIRVVMVENTIVPGLLQTYDYAMEVIDLGVRALGIDDADVAEGAAQRINYGRFVFDSSKSFRFVITEPVLHWVYGSREVMAGQLDQLLRVMDLPNVELGIIPQSRPVQATVYQPFWIVDDEVYVELPSGLHADSSPTSLRAYLRVAEFLMAGSAVGDEARELVLAAREHHLETRSTT
jgi:hypothetical protein